LTGFCENCPSGSLPCQVMRTAGVTSTVPIAEGDGLMIVTIGAIVYE